MIRMLNKGATVTSTTHVWIENQWFELQQQWHFALYTHPAAKSNHPGKPRWTLPWMQRRHLGEDLFTLTSGEIDCMPPKKTGLRECGSISQRLPMNLEHAMSFTKMVTPKSFHFRNGF